MKTGFYFLLITLFTINSMDAFTQYNLKEVNVNSGNFRLLRMPYSSSGGEKGISSFEYDNEGKLIKSTWKLLNNTRSSINHYTYDVQGNIIKKDREFSDNLTSSEDFLYDNKNRLIQEIFKRSDGFSFKINYSYNEIDQILNAKLENYHGWLSGEIYYSYTDNNLIKEGQIFKDNKNIGHIDFKYNELNQITEEYWEFTGSYNQTFTFEYGIPNIAYSSSNVFITNTDKYKIVNEDYGFNGETGGPSIYYYSSGSKLEKKLFKVDDKIKTSTTYNYNSTGLLTSSLRVFTNGNETLFRYKFNEDKQLTERIYFNNDSIVGHEYYEYQQGLLTKGEYENFDSWLSGSISFEHNKTGELTTGIFKGKDGFDAIIYFTYDENRNISKIHWVFSFGKTQTYTFVYEEINSNSK